MNYILDKILDKLIEFIKLCENYKVILSIFYFSFLWYILDLQPFDKNITWLDVACFSLALILGNITVYLYEPAKERLKSFHKKINKRKKIVQLTKRQKSILSEYMLNDIFSIYFSFEDQDNKLGGDLVRLMQIGYLSRGNLDIYGADYHIDEWTYTFLKKHPQYLE